MTRTAPVPWDGRDQPRWKPPYPRGGTGLGHVPSRLTSPERITAVRVAPVAAKEVISVWHRTWFPIPGVWLETGDARTVFGPLIGSQHLSGSAETTPSGARGRRPDQPNYRDVAQMGRMTGLSRRSSVDPRRAGCRLRPVLRQTMAAACAGGV